MLHGTDAFGYLSESPELAGLFNDAMTALSEVFAASVTDAYDFTAFNVVVDVGGGHGRLVSAILSACPGVRGVLYDLPDVVAGAPPGSTASASATECASRVDHSSPTRSR